MMVTRSTDRCPAGLDPSEWRLFLRLVDAHLAIAEQKRAAVQAAILEYSKQRRPW